MLKGRKASCPASFAGGVALRVATLIPKTKKRFERSVFAHRLRPAVLRDDIDYPMVTEEAGLTLTHQPPFKPGPNPPSIFGGGPKRVL